MSINVLDAMLGLMFLFVVLPFLCVFFHPSIPLVAEQAALSPVVCLAGKCLRATAGVGCPKDRIFATRTTTGKTKPGGRRRAGSGWKRSPVSIGESSAVSFFPLAINRPVQAKCEWRFSFFDIGQLTIPDLPRH